MGCGGLLRVVTVWGQCRSAKAAKQRYPQPYTGWLPNHGSVACLFLEGLALRTAASPMYDHHVDLLCQQF